MAVPTLVSCTWKSDQITNATANPITQNGGDVVEAVEKVVCFTVTATAAQNDTIALALIPAGARILGGRLDYTAWGSSVTLTLGDGTTANKYLTSTSIASASQSDFANTWALYGLAREALGASGATLVATIGGATPTAASVIRGYVKYAIA